MVGGLSNIIGNVLWWRKYHLVEELYYVLWCRKCPMVEEPSDIICNLLWFRKCLMVEGRLI